MDESIVEVDEAIRSKPTLKECVILLNGGDFVFLMNVVQDIVANPQLDCSSIPLGTIAEVLRDVIMVERVRAAVATDDATRIKTKRTKLAVTALRVNTLPGH